MSSIQVFDVNDTENALRAAVFEILDSVRLLTLATVNDEDQPHVNTCYFSNDHTLNLFVLTPPTARHSEYANLRSRVAVNIFDTAHKVGDPISGLQLSGEFSSLDDNEARRAYSSYCAKHPALLKFVPNYEFIVENMESRFFLIKVVDGQIISEPRFGSENYIKFEVRR